jgi:predicted RNase H-like HicB family nuclease
MKSDFSVFANWDPDAGVWVATSDDVPGLATEAPTVEALLEKLKVMIPELLEANDVADGGDIAVTIQSTATVVVTRNAA